jgi:hypothetical protein
MAQVHHGERVEGDHPTGIGVLNLAVGYHPDTVPVITVYDD